MFIGWYDVTINELLRLWQGFIGFIPKLIGAIIIFLVGWVVSVALGKLVAEILRRIQFNKIFEKGGWKTALEKADIKVDASGFIGAIFKWVLMIVFLLAAVEVLGFVEFADFLTEVLAYLPNVIVAALIFVVTVVITDILQKIVEAAVEGTKIGYRKFAGAIVKWSIWIFAILMILYQLEIGRTFMTDLFKGIVAMIVIAVGLAFGLGGKEVAAGILQDLRRKLKGE